LATDILALAKTRLGGLIRLANQKCQRYHATSGDFRRIRCLPGSQPRHLEGKAGINIVVNVSMNIHSLNDGLLDLSLVDEQRVDFGH
jgi:hypothetical protein